MSFYCCFPELRILLVNEQVPASHSIICCYETLFTSQQSSLSPLTVLSVLHPLCLVLLQLIGCLALPKNVTEHSMLSIYHRSLVLTLPGSSQMPPNSTYSCVLNDFCLLLEAVVLFFVKFFKIIFFKVDGWGEWSPKSPQLKIRVHILDLHSHPSSDASFSPLPSLLWVTLAPALLRHTSMLGNRYYKSKKIYVVPACVSFPLL